MWCLHSVNTISIFCVNTNQFHPAIPFTFPRCDYVWLSTLHATPPLQHTSISSVSVRLVQWLAWVFLTKERKKESEGTRGGEETSESTYFLQSADSSSVSKVDEMLCKTGFHWIRTFVRTQHNSTLNLNTCNHFFFEQSGLADPIFNFQWARLSSFTHLLIWCIRNYIRIFSYSIFSILELLIFNCNFWYLLATILEMKILSACKSIFLHDP